jgi:hypothetical protein
MREQRSLRALRSSLPVYPRAAGGASPFLFSVPGAAASWRRCCLPPLLGDAWLIYIGNAICWETHAEASSVCYDRDAAMQNPFLSSHESFLFQSRTTPLSPNKQAQFDFFSFHACT